MSNKKRLTHFRIIITKSNIYKFFYISIESLYNRILQVPKGFLRIDKRKSEGQKLKSLKGFAGDIYFYPFKRLSLFKSSSVQPASSMIPFKVFKGKVSLG